MTDLDTKQPEFALSFRGYDRAQVDDYVSHLQWLVADAEQRAHAAEAEARAREADAMAPARAWPRALGGQPERDLQADSSADRDLVVDADVVEDAALAEIIFPAEAA